MVYAKLILVGEAGQVVLGFETEAKRTAYIQEYPQSTQIAHLFQILPIAADEAETLCPASDYHFVWRSVMFGEFMRSYSHVATSPMTPSDMGKKGGSATTEAKRAASAANGKKGGRPKKTMKQIYAITSLEGAKAAGADFYVHLGPRDKRAYQGDLAEVVMDCYLRPGVGKNTGFWVRDVDFDMPRGHAVYSVCADIYNARTGEKIRP